MAFGTLFHIRSGHSGTLPPILITICFGWVLLVKRVNCQTKRQLCPVFSRANSKLEEQTELKRWSKFHRLSLDFLLLFGVWFLYFRTPSSNPLKVEGRPTIGPILDGSDSLEFADHSVFWFRVSFQIVALFCLPNPLRGRKSCPHRSRQHHPHAVWILSLGVGI